MMTTDDMACNELINIDVDTLAPHDLKQEKLKLSATLRKYYSFCKRRTFGTFVASKRASTTVWNCCGQTFKELSSIHKHVARTHDTDIHQLTQSTFEVLLSQIEKEATSQQQSTNNQSQWTFPPGYLTPVTGDQLHK